MLKLAKGVSMNLGLKERRLILNWFDIAVECDTLKDVDLKLYDKLRETVEDEEDTDDPLVYNPKKKNSGDNLGFEEGMESRFDMDEYSNDDKY